MDKNSLEHKQMLEREQAVVDNLKAKGFPNPKASDPDEEHWDMNDIQVAPGALKFRVSAYIGGVFNHNPLKIVFKEAEIYFNMLYKNTGYMPQYGDGMQSDTTDDEYWSNKEFVVVSKSFMVDDYFEVILVVVPEHVFLNKFNWLI